MIMEASFFLKNFVGLLFDIALFRSLFFSPFFFCKDHEISGLVHSKKEMFFWSCSRRYIICTPLKYWEV